MFFFSASLQCFGFFVVDEAEGPDSCAKVDRMRLCRVGAAAVLATKLSLRLSLSSIQLPRRRGLPNRPADNTRWTAKWTLGFHGIPRVHGRAGNRGTRRRSWAAVGRLSPWDLVMSMYSRECLRSTPPPYRHPLQWCCCVSSGLLQMRPAALLLVQDCPTSVALGAAGCGSINLLATETRKQPSSDSYAQLHGCMRCAPVCEVDCDRRKARSEGVSARLS